MKDIIILSDFCGNLDGKDNNRFIYIANILGNGNKVEIVTSNYNHYAKKHFTTNYYDSSNKITMLSEPGYKKNVCLKRFYSHYKWGKNVEKYLSRREKPDIVYCCVPTLKASYEAARFCKKNNIRFIIDVQDLWPDAFKVAFNVPIISSLMFLPFSVMVNSIYKKADYIVGLSETNLKRVRKVNKKANELCLYLGTDLNIVDENISKQEILYKKDNDKVWIGYLGSLGNSYDIENCIKAMTEVERKYQNVQLVLIGDGPLESNLKILAKEMRVEALFLGRQDYIAALKILSQCDIALNPFKKGADQSITNKITDYAALGIPVINTLENEEYEAMVENNNIGLNAKCEDYNSISAAILWMLENKEERIKMGKNNRILAENLFDRGITYKEIINIIYNEKEEKI